MTTTRRLVIWGSKRRGASPMRPPTLDWPRQSLLPAGFRWRALPPSCCQRGRSLRMTRYRLSLSPTVGNHLHWALLSVAILQPLSTSATLCLPTAPTSRSNALRESPRSDTCQWLCGCQLQSHVSASRQPGSLHSSPADRTECNHRWMGPTSAQRGKDFICCLSESMEDYGEL